MCGVTEILSQWARTPVGFDRTGGFRGTRSWPLAPQGSGQGQTHLAHRQLRRFDGLLLRQPRVTVDLFHWALTRAALVQRHGILEPLLGYGADRDQAA